MSTEIKDYLRRMNVPALYWGVELEKVKKPQAITVSKYISNFVAYRKKGWGLLLWGQYGSGKSACAAVILKEAVIGNKMTGLWVFADQIPAYVIDRTRFDAQELWLERMISVDLLVIDELILHRKDTFMDTAIEMVFRRRLTAQKPTIITSNISPKQFEDNYPAMHSALTEAIFPVKFEGSFRVDAAAEMAKEFKNG